MSDDDSAVFDPIEVELGRRLFQRRIELGMPQRDLGRAVGVSLSAIQKYERGENRIAASRLSALAEALEIDVAYFFGDARQVPPELRGDAPSRYSLEILKLLRDLGPADQRLVLSVTRRLHSGDEWPDDPGRQERGSQVDSLSQV